MKTIEDAEVIRAFEQRIRQELAETMRAIAADEDSSAPVELDQQRVGRLSRMDAMQQQAMARNLAVRRRERAVALERALARLRDGAFGYCTECGEPTAVRRLEIDPSFRTCVRCTP